MRTQPSRGAAHRVLVVLVDEFVDRALEPFERELLEVVALVEAEHRPVGAECGISNWYRCSRMNRSSASNVRHVILHDLKVDEHEFEARTGWSIKPQGACKAEACVLLPASARLDDGRLDAHVISERLGMP